MSAARKLFVADLFCGAGGTSTGLAMACKELGRAVELLAINHWGRAIETHKKNHPWARHLCASLETLDPRKVVPGGRLDLLVASPECTHHSVARGGRPMNDQSRASAFRVLEWCDKLDVSNVLIENVPEFENWGPIGVNGRPLKSKRGETFRNWVTMLEGMNYKVDRRILNSADYGGATTRRRLFVIARKRTGGISWPQPTHSKDGGKGGRLFGELKPWRAAREIIDWDIQGESIFTRKRPLARTTLERIAAGLKKFCGDAAEPFLVILRRHMDGKSIDEPIPCLTANGQHIGIAIPKAFILGQQSNSAPRATEDSPIPTVATAGKIALIEPKAFITVLNANNVPKSPDQPLPTVTGGNRFFLTEPVVLGQQSGGAPRSAGQPIPTITTDGAIAVCMPGYIVPNFGERKGQAPRTHDVEVPLPAPTSHGAGGLVEPAFIVTPGGPNLPDGSSAAAPLPVVTCKDRLAVVDPTFIVEAAHGGGDARRAHSVDQPLGVQACTKSFAVVKPEFIVGAGGPERGAKPVTVEAPLGTLTTRSHKAVIQPIIVGLEHTGANGNQVRSTQEPLLTVSAHPRLGVAEPVIVPLNHGAGDVRAHSPNDPMPCLTSVDAWAIVQPHLVKFYRDPKSQHQSVDDPLHTVPTKDRFGLVEPTVGLDIRFRMLRPPELARAMGFENYMFTGTREEQVKQIGNAVEVNTARALVMAILES